jgi:hypothetical protein
MSKQSSEKTATSYSAVRLVKGDDSAERVRLMLASKHPTTLRSPETIDPIAAAILNNPGLTRERACEIAELFGF